jgi:predicted Fe-Mo cluster-binding NifX family protein
MKICITAQGDGLEAEIDPRFGRAAYFLIVDTDKMEVGAFPNPYMRAGGGAGIQAAQFVANKDVEAVITGNIGPNAFKVLGQAGLNVITGVSGIVKAALENYNKNEFKKSEGPTVNEKFGVK